MYTKLLLVVLLCGCQAAPTDSAAETPLLPGSIAVGSNLTGVIDYSAEWTFVDAFKASRAWISGSSSQWDDGRALDLDASGWVKSLLPGQLARTLLMPSGHYPAGKYIVLYDGVGTMTYGGGGKRDDAASKPGRDVVDVTGQSPIILSITASTPGNNVRNIRFIMPGFEQTYATQIFHPTFLSRLQGYGALRFMDWMETNNSTVVTWNDMPKVSDARWTKHGVPIEIIVELANRTGKDVWLNVPHQADDMLITQLAQYVHDHLAPTRKAYYEYSNEVWNSIFAQSSWCEQKGLALGLATTGFEARLRFVALRSSFIFKTLETLYAGQMDRVVRVMPAQAANSWTSTVALDHGDVYKHTDALAIAPYFGGYLGATTRSWTLDELFDELETKSVPESVAWVKAQAAVAKQRNVKLVAYEGGNHLAGIHGNENDVALNAVFDAANRDPRMKRIYKSYLDGWKANGGQLFMNFVNCSEPNKWGRWGALEYLEQPRKDAPKYDALQTFIESNP